MLKIFIIMMFIFSFSLIAEELGLEGDNCSQELKCAEEFSCSDEGICEKKSKMDFSEVVIESDQLDEAEEEKEEKIILKDLKEKRKAIKTESLKKKKKEPTNFLQFLPLYLDISYLNLSLLDIPYNNNLAIEFGTSIFSIILSDFQIKLARVAIAPTYKLDLSAFEIAPVSFAYRLRTDVHHFLFELELYKTYYLFNKMKVEKGEYILKWHKYFSLKSSWYILDKKDKSLKLFFETALVSGDHRDSNSSFSFSLGITGDISLLQFSF